MMFVLLNIVSLVALAFSVVPLGYFVYAWKTQVEQDKVQKWMRVASGIIMAFVVLIAVIEMAAVLVGYQIFNPAIVVSAWMMVATTLISQAIIFGCLRDDIKGDDYSVLLSLIAFTIGVLAVTYVASLTSSLGEDMDLASYCSAICLNLVSFMGTMLLWYYVCLIGRLTSKFHKTLTQVFQVLTALGALAFVTSPFTGLVVNLDETKPGVTYGVGYLVAFMPFIIVGVAAVVQIVRMKASRIEKVALIGLVAAVPLGRVLYTVGGHIAIMPLLLSLACLGCYLGIVSHHEKSIERHLVQVDMASSIQQGMLPQEFPDDVRFAAYGHMWPAKEVAGDFYDFYQVGKDHIYLTVADVSGKDVPAAMFMAKAYALMHEFEKDGLPPHEIFNKVNAALAQGNSQKLFVTAWMGKLNLSKGILTCANAGHNPPIFVRTGVGCYYQKSKPNLMLGIRKRTRYDRHSLLLKKDDRIVLYTDGVTESINQKEEQFGEDRLLDFVRDNVDNLDPKAFSEGLFAEVNRFADGMEQFDDVTVLGVVYRGDKMTNVKDFADEIFIAQKDQLDAVNEFVETAAARMGYPEDHFFKLEMAIEEIFVNVCSYAYADKAEPGQVRISVMLLDDKVSILFADTGIPFNPLMQEPPNFTERARKRSVGGLGIHLVRKFMDDVRYEYADGENRLTIEKDLVKE